jgi:predicted Zn-dependent protease
MFGGPRGNLTLTISTYNGDTPEAQITILLHELGHIIGRLPEDDESWDGRSLRNTAEVSRHCKIETRAAAHNGSRGSIRARNSGD